MAAKSSKHKKSKISQRSRQRHHSNNLQANWGIQIFNLIKKTLKIVSLIQETVQSQINTKVTATVISKSLSIHSFPTDSKKETRTWGKRKKSTLKSLDSRDLWKMREP